MRVNINSHKKTGANLVAPIARMRAAGLTIRESIGSIKISAPIEFEALPDGRTMLDLISEIRGPR